MADAIEIVFHGRNAASFVEGFDALLEVEATIRRVPDEPATEADAEALRRADVIIGNRFQATQPRPERLRLYHVSATGTDGIALDALPPGATVCNCYGHEPAMAEYVMAALLSHQVKLFDADRRLRKGEWPYRAGAAANIHGEIGGRTLGLLGFGHIGRAVAARAKAFGMTIHVANRSPVPVAGDVDASHGLDDLSAFYAAADFIVVSLPLLPETRGLVDAATFDQMRPDAVLMNVGRGPVVDEAALYEALAHRRIGGAVIDTWYRYPEAEGDVTAPSRFDFAALDNVVMTPHMSAWTDGTIRRRQATMADNINRHFTGRACNNVVRPAG